MAGLLDGIRVLVVEDDADSRFVLQESMRLQGATVESVSTAADAAASLDCFDVVITDFELPDHDGVWLVKQSTSRARPVPIILLSGFAESQRPAIATAPFALKLLKPIDPLDLGLAIFKTLKGLSAT